MVPHGTANREEIRSRLDQRLRIFRRNAADGYARYFGNQRPFLQRIKFSNMLYLLGAGRKECSESHIIRTRLCGLHGEVAAIVTGHANLRVFSKLAPCLGNFAIALPQMHAIRFQSLGERDAVVDDECDIMRSADGLQRLGKRGSLMLVDIFHAKLKRGNRASGQRVLQLLGKITTHFERRNQVKLAISVGHAGFIATRVSRCK